MKNAPNASGPTPDYVPVFEDFVQAIQLIRQFQLEDVLAIHLESDGKIGFMV
ncbi:MAG: hypothetical protein GWN10_15295, partial [Nitrospinaceae bacterium]|nr:hypothetical protein [Nitrospinaceae bacterium]